jgi:hypothetical protein
MVDTKGNNDDASGPKRRLDLGTKPKEIVNPYKNRKPVDNPYAKKQKSTSTNTEESNHPVSGTVAGSTAAPSATTSIITPETGIEKFFVKDKKNVGKKASSAKRKLVSPGRSGDASANTSEEEIEDLYYHSDDSNTQSKNKQRSNYHPDHIHGNIDYHHRGEVSLTSGQMNAYRFIRNHFNIPRDIEVDSKFGPWSGTCFEERILRAYTLDQLKSKSGDGSLLRVCTYCGEEGHKRDRCMKLI